MLVGSCAGLGELECVTAMPPASGSRGFYIKRAQQSRTEATFLENVVDARQVLLPGSFAGLEDLVLDLADDEQRG